MFTSRSSRRGPSGLVAAVPVLLLMMGLAGGGCGTVDHVDFPADPDASADGGGGRPGADGAECTPNDRADCAGYCGKLLGRCGEVIDCGACTADLTCGGA